MKKAFSTLFLLSVLAGCSSSVKMVGSVNMISSRNVDSKTDYVLIKTGTDDSKSYFKKNKGATVDQAINNAVTNIPGGEFLKNAKIYTDGKEFAVNGDVWGLPESANIEGFRIGDKVLIKNSILNKEKFTSGEITGFKDRKTCIVKVSGGSLKEITYTELSRAEN